MANYKGLDCVMGEITHMACAAKDSIHEQHVYEYFAAMEKYVRTAVPQLFRWLYTIAIFNRSAQNSEKTVRIRTAKSPILIWHIYVYAKILLNDCLQRNDFRYLRKGYLPLAEY